MPDSLRKRVLVVDDEAAIAHGVAMRLEASGYDVETAEDGEKGVDAARRGHPDVVLMDVRMPRMDGREALVTLRADQATADIPIIMLSASLRDQQEALRSGASFFLTKPYRCQELLAAIEHVLPPQISMP
ncbi:MAG: response regulator [Planctomycetales bacterium]|nr:response regulator [Planctomycetales bacterium]